ncbi:CatA-like O-acetyltransferase [Lacinutrix sp. 5H-3-7-4]|uniref:CatA-like O-acetyltransferase n=1 Tax=Lacinutrix sp. (strain 5H-3-7-4) TaxID=983544 RepID=UPI00020A3CEB|nr:CatA-like O-acetyltransferase [Lacinutrix sp. 5H-3-7-4]AEH02478.1 chloramphenicol acetyltransferase [Lacinutrix sp. 5H-3-7-4]
MREIVLNTWNRKQHFEHFKTLKDPYFAITFPLNVTATYKFSKENKLSFFGVYLHDCMKAINSTENLRYRIVNEKVIDFETINASATIMRADKTFGFSFIEFNENLNLFLKNLECEKQRIINSKDLFPPKNGLDCVHASAMPWLHFSGHKEPVSGIEESVPKLAFSKVLEENGIYKMNVSINVNHALVDGYHLAMFAETFQNNLNNK